MIAALQRDPQSIEPRKLLAVVYYYPPVSAVGALRPGRFVKYLAGHGYRSQVVAARSQPNLIDTETVRYFPPATPDRLDRLSKFAGRVLHKAGNWYSDRLDWTIPAIRAAGKCCRKERIDVLLTSFPPICGVLAGLWLKHRYGMQWVADMRDPFAGSPFRSGQRFQFLEYFFERMMVKQADLVLTVTDVLAEELSDRYPEATGKIHVIWNGFDPEEEFGPAPKPERGYELLLHAGDLYGARHPGIILDSMLRLSQRGRLKLSDHRLLQIGPQDAIGLDTLPSYRALLEQGYFQLRTDRVTRTDALAQIATADRLLLLDMNERNLGHTVPAKLFDYVRAQHPILALTPDGSAVERILRRGEIPHVAMDPLSAPEKVDEKLMEFLQIPAEPRRAGAWFWETFDGKKQVDQVADLMRKMLE